MIILDKQMSLGQFLSVFYLLTFAYLFLMQTVHKGEMPWINGVTGGWPREQQLHSVWPGWGESLLVTWWSKHWAVSEELISQRWWKFFSHIYDGHILKQKCAQLHISTKAGWHPVWFLTPKVGEALWKKKSFDQRNPLILCVQLFFSSSCSFWV